MSRKNLGIYIHIPFCVKKCLYCDFLSAPSTDKERREYVDALIKEIEYYALEDIDLSSQYEVTSVFFGGGTPSILEGEVIGSILQAVRERFVMSQNPEITIECNPGTANAQKLAYWRTVGINRLSIGLQSANNEELKHLGRIHKYEDFLEVYRLAREAGFDNINVDLMSAIPGQSLESYRDTLDKVIALRPEHISSYSLIVEEDTPFYEIYGEEKEGCGGVNARGEVVAPGTNGVERWPDLPDEDTEREMYYATDDILKQAGYHRYEISNYSLEERECRHNKSYWDGTDYIGFGLGASSYIKKIRYTNTDDWYKYINSCMAKGVMQNQPYYVGAGDYSGDEDDCFEEETEEARALSTEELGQLLLAEKYHDAIQLVSDNEQMEEFMYLGLRMMRGVSKAEFENRFHVSMDSVYGAALEKLIKEELLSKDGDIVALTAKGIDVSNRVLANFLL